MVQHLLKWRTLEFAVLLYYIPTWRHKKIRSMSPDFIVLFTFFFILVHIVWITFLWHLTKYCSLFLSPSPHILFLLVLVDTSVKLKTIVHLFTFAYSVNYLASNQWFTFHKKIIVHLFTLAISFIFLASNQWITTWHITCQGWHWPAWHKFSHIWFSLEKL